MTAANANLLDELRSPSLSPSLLPPLLHKLFSHPKIHNGFVDILSYPSVRAALANMDDGKRSALVKTVELFAFGTVSQYFSLREKEEVWALNDAQLEKLRMLSVVSIAREQIENGPRKDADVEMADDAPRRRSKGKKGKRKPDGGVLAVPYARLAAELRIPATGEAYDAQTHVRQLEDLLIQCIYSNVVAAKLDQASQSLQIEPQVSVAREAAGSGGSGAKKGKDAGGVHGSLLSRDLDTSTPEATKGEVTRMISTIQTFLKGSAALLSTLEAASAVTAADRTTDEQRWRTVQKAVDEAPSKFREGGPGGGGGVLGQMLGGGDPMEGVDLAAGRRQGKRSRGGHSMMEGLVRFR
ncbi:hypothetical protein ACHAXT_010813 [Thalassiosira profunda]